MCQKMDSFDSEMDDREAWADDRDRKSILYIENDDFVNDVVDKMLHRLGYDVLVTRWSSEAIRLMQARPDLFDLVITDLKMPVMNGLELSGILHEIRPDIPIILTTGQTDFVVDLNMEAVGIRAVLPKPFGVDKLSGVIKSILE